MNRASIGQQYGIRIRTWSSREYRKTEDFGNFNFETITLCPIDTRLVRKLLTKNEIGWLNAYHEMVYNKLKKHLTKQKKSG